MAKPTKLPSGRWRIRYVDAEGIQRASRGTFATFKEATTKQREIEDEVSKGDHISPDQDITVAEWAEEFYPTEYDLRPQTKSQNDRTWKNHLQSKWGERKLNSIKQAEVQRWLAELASGGRKDGKPMSPNTLLQVKGQFSKLMTAAVESGRLKRSPMPPKRKRGTKRVSQKAIRFLTDEEIMTLVKAINPAFRVLILVACYSGLRVRELFALRPRDVDREHKSLIVTRAQIDLAGHISYSDDLKTEAGHRSVPLADHVYAELEDHVKGIGPNDLIFNSATGGPIRLENFRSRYFNKAVKAANLAPFTPHDMRHTAASIFISEGVSPWMLADILGHADTRMIDKVYGHLFHKDREDFRKRMSKRVGRVAAKAATSNVVPLRSARKS